jgi:hypothetical protein
MADRHAAAVVKAAEKHAGFIRMTGVTAQARCYAAGGRRAGRKSRCRFWEKVPQKREA